MGFGVVGYTSRDIDLVYTTAGYTRQISLPVYTTAGYTRPISLPVYTTAGYASSDMDLVYTATGSARNDIESGCTTIENIELTALGTGYLGVPVLYTAVRHASSDINHAVISFVYPAIGYACSDFILACTAFDTLTVI